MALGPPSEERHMNKTSRFIKKGLLTLILCMAATNGLAQMDTLYVTGLPGQAVYVNGVLVGIGSEGTVSFNSSGQWDPMGSRIEVRVGKKVLLFQGGKKKGNAYVWANDEPPSVTEQKELRENAKPGSKRGLNALDWANEIPDGGGYDSDFGPGKPGSTGVPQDITFKGETILRANGKGSYFCNGFTFDTFMRTAGALGLIEDKTVNEIRVAQRTWYGNPSGVENPAIKKDIIERQSIRAIEDLGIGNTVPFDGAKRSDFMQMWRTDGSGHQGIFMGWIKDGDTYKIIGATYRGAQSKTNGVKMNNEYFDDTPNKSGSLLVRSRTYFGRLKPQ